MTDDKTANPPIVSTLEQASEGLMMMSETDAPFKVVYFASEGDEKAAFTPKKLAELAGAPADAEIETRELKRFFKAAVKVEDWMNEEEKATAKRFADLYETLKTQLEDAQVVAWGDAEKQVAILGKCEGGLAGVKTLVVET